MADLRKMLKRHEGVRNKKYRCTKGHWTIGIGWNLDANPLPTAIAMFLKEHGYITNEMIEQLLDISIETATRDCYKLYPAFDTFTENRRFALIDFLFNLGFVRASTFINTNKAINEGRWSDAAHGIKHSAYWRQLGGDPEGTDDGKLERPEEIAQMILEG